MFCGRGPPGEQPVLLIDHPHRAGALDAAGGRLIEAGEDVQERRLAAAGRADHRDELALANRQRDVLQRFDGAEGAGDGFEPEPLSGHSPT